jgi:glycosyltransferase involved in cell wall biosynthesis
MVDVTVILCTYNRCQSLARALESVAAQILSESVEWEVLVVDNNSSDQTGEVVQDFSGRYPGRFRYLFESKQGLSHARNAGIRAARGEIVLYTMMNGLVREAGSFPSGPALRRPGFQRRNGTGWLRW